MAHLTLHIGAHRTGSTHLQRLLDANSAEIADMGMVALCPPRPGQRDAAARLLRSSLAKALRPGQTGLSAWRHGRALRGVVTARAKGAGHIILSDENILGEMWPAHGGGFYGDGAARVARLVRILRPEALRLVLCTREYGGLAASYIAMHAAYTGARHDSDEVAGALATGEAGGWHRLVAELRRALPDAVILLCPVETCPPETALGAVLGPDAPHDQLRGLPEARSNLRPSCEALDALARLRREGHTPGRAEIDQILSRHAGGTPFNPFSPDTVTALRLRYLSDMDALRAGEVEAVQVLHQ